MCTIAGMQPGVELRAGGCPCESGSSRRRIARRLAFEHRARQFTPVIPSRMRPLRLDRKATETRPARILDIHPVILSPRGFRHFPSPFSCPRQRFSGASMPALLPANALLPAGIHIPLSASQPSVRFLCPRSVFLGRRAPAFHLVSPVPFLRSPQGLHAGGGVLRSHVLWRLAGVSCAGLAGVAPGVLAPGVCTLARRARACRIPGIATRRARTGGGGGWRQQSATQDATRRNSRSGGLLAAKR